MTPFSVTVTVTVTVTVRLEFGQNSEDV